MYPRVVSIWLLSLISVVQSQHVASGAEALRYIQYNPSDTSFLEATEPPLEAPKSPETVANERWEALMQQTSGLSNALSSLQETLIRQKERELELGKDSNALNRRILDMGRESHALNLTLIAGASLIVCLLILLSYWFQLKCFRQMAELSRSIPALQSHALGLLASESPSTSKLLEAIHLLEHRIEQLQEGSRSALKAPLEAPLPQVGAPTAHGVSPDAPGTSVASGVSQLVDRGQMLLDKECFPEAVTCFSDALSVDPSNVEAHLKKGIALERMNRLEAALSCYDEVLRLKPQRTIASVYKSRVLTALHRYDEALSVYESTPGKMKGDSLTLEWLEGSAKKR